MHGNDTPVTNSSVNSRSSDSTDTSSSSQRQNDSILDNVKNGKNVEGKVSDNKLNDNDNLDLNSANNDIILNEVIDKVIEHKKSSKDRSKIKSKIKSKDKMPENNVRRSNRLNGKRVRVHFD